MANTLLIGFSGLATHQRMIEVVGNNLANINTTGFKSQRTSFSDLFYETVKQGSGGARGVIGGSNPAQIGNGSQLASIGRNFAQGGQDTTGRELDFALIGEGFFVLNSDKGPFYTRAGAFNLDDEGYLVDSGTGYHVQSYGTILQPSMQTDPFATPGSNSIRLPIGAEVPGQASSVVNLRGNVPTTGVPAEAQQLTMASPLTVGTVSATVSDLLNSLDNITTPYVAGDSITVSGLDREGVPFSATVPVDGSTTLQDLLDGINGIVPDVQATLDATGRIVIEAADTGNSLLDVDLSNTAGNTGAADFALHGFQITTAGSDGTTVAASLDVFDDAGNGHTVRLELRPQLDGSWTVTALMDPVEGTLLDGSVEGIRFNANGSIQSAGLPGTGDVNLVFQFAGSSSTQAVRLELGDPGSRSHLYADNRSSLLATDQDGYAIGTLVGVSVDEGGVVEGVTDKGRRFPLAQLAIATFRNTQGLNAYGNNLFQETSSSGDAEVGAGRVGGRGSVRSGTLEQSNVDIATEFSRLIIAQRGFSANSRTITVTAEILEELTNLIR
jgi:flagellar hook protein FlgE